MFTKSLLSTLGRGIIHLETELGQICDMSDFMKGLCKKENAEEVKQELGIDSQLLAVESFDKDTGVLKLKTISTTN